MNYEDDFHPAQIAAIQKMTPGERLDAAVEMFHAAREFQAAVIGTTHPDWSQEQIWGEVGRRLLYAKV